MDRSRDSSALASPWTTLTEALSEWDTSGTLTCTTPVSACSSWWGEPVYGALKLVLMEGSVCPLEIWFGVLRSDGVSYFSFSVVFGVVRSGLCLVRDDRRAVVVSPDAGGVYRAKKFREGLAQRYGLDAGLAMIIKQRAMANEVRSPELLSPL